MATLTAIRPAEATPVMTMAIQRTASISEMAVSHRNTLDFSLPKLAPNRLPSGYRGYAGYNDDFP